MKSFYNFVVTKLPPCPAAQVQQCSGLTRCRAPQNRSAPKCSLPRKCSRTQLTPQTRTGSTLGRLAVGLDQGRSLCKNLWRSVCSIGLNLYWGCCCSHCIVCWVPHHPDPIGCSRLMQSTTVLQPTKTQPITSLCANGSITGEELSFFLISATG